MSIGAKTHLKFWTAGAIGVAMTVAYVAPKYPELVKNQPELKNNQ